MRIENPALPASWPDVAPGEKPGESPRAHGKGVQNDSESKKNEIPREGTFFPSHLRSSSGTYSPASLKAIAEYHAKFLTVAENNLQAANHSARIPQLLLDRLNKAGS